MTCIEGTLVDFFLQYTRFIALDGTLSLLSDEIIREGRSVHKNSLPSTTRAFNST